MDINSDTKETIRYRYAKRRLVRLIALLVLAVLVYFLAKTNYAEHFTNTL